MSNKLTAIRVKKETKPGLYSDGGNLYLQVTSPTAKSWIFLYRKDGKLRYHGLGSVGAIGLAEARERAAVCRNQRANGVDPIEARLEAKAKARPETSMTFQDCAKTYIAAHRASWKTDRQAVQWTNTLASYAYPFIGTTPVDRIDVHSVFQVLEPIWLSKNETASRVRMRIENILDWAKVKGFRSGDNPAMLQGNLDHLLPERSKVAPVVHHSALRYSELPAFLRELQAQEGVSARAFEFLILTASRTSEVLQAKWSEIDFESRVWLVPAGHMKMHREHRVPLCDRAMAILQQIQELQTGDYIFPGAKAGRPLSSMAFLMLLRRMGRTDITPHGMRSSFRDWSGNETNYPREVCEAALAHLVGSAVELAYRRGDALEKRRGLMEAWADSIEPNTISTEHHVA